MLATTVLADLFSESHEQIDYFFEHIDQDQVDAVFSLLRDCQGTVFFTGVGKSGIVAKKIAMTMVSTGTRALYLSPTNAGHGDLGIVKAGDVFVFLSKSGETEELMHLVPFVRNKGAQPVAVVSNISSRLAKACNFAVVLPLSRELCPFNLAPTTSTTIQLIFGDVLTVALMQAKGFDIDDYALNHPSGSIGKRITVKVSDLMLSGQDLPLCHLSQNLSEVLVELSNKRCGCLLVVDDTSKLCGIFTDGDLRRGLQRYGSSVLDRTMADIVTRNPKTIGPNALAWEAMQPMAMWYTRHAVE